MFRDLRYGARMLRKNPGFTLVAALTLALGIGANTAIFSVIEGVILRPLPYKDPQRLCVLWKSVPARNIEWDWTSYPTINDWREGSRSFEDMAVILRPQEVTLPSADAGLEKIRASKVTGNFFAMLGVTPLLGRTFTDDEARRGIDAAVLSYGFWQQRFGGDTTVLGRSIHLDNRSTTIIGVMPASFQFPNKSAQLWMLLTADPRWPAFQLQRYRIADAFSALARLKPGVTIEQARSEMNIIAGRLAQQYPATDANLGIRVVSLFDEIAGAQVRRNLWILGGAVLSLLLIACSNIASLLVARGATRRKELAVRAALGAGRWRLLRQLALENILLSLAGGLFGLLFAYWALDALLALVPADLPRADGIAINIPVLAFTFILCLITGIVFGLLPGSRITRGNLHANLQESGRSASAGADVRRARGLLVALQFALAIVLLAGAGLMIRSFLLLNAVKPGFDTSHLLTMGVTLHDDGDEAQFRRFYEEAMQKIEQLPGIRGAAVGETVTGSFAGHIPNESVVVEGRPATQDPERHGRNIVSDNYFRVMGIPLREGRFFSPEDQYGKPGVAVINEAMARRGWPSESPLGKRFKEVLPGLDGKWLTVIGVVGDVATNRDGRVYPWFYITYRQWSLAGMNLVVRTETPPLQAAAAIRRAVISLDSTIPNFEITTVEQALADLDRERRFQTELIGIFAVTALLLAALGLYGLMSYLVAQRTKEIGIRVALGAQRRDLLKLVVGQGMAVALPGVLFGMGAALVITRLIRSLLFGVSAADPLTFGMIALLLLGVALAACVIPAREATRVDPISALRDE